MANEEIIAKLEWCLTNKNRVDERLLREVLKRLKNPIGFNAVEFWRNFTKPKGAPKTSSEVFRALSLAHLKKTGVEISDEQKKALWKELEMLEGKGQAFQGLSNPTGKIAEIKDTLKRYATMSPLQRSAGMKDALSWGVDRLQFLLKIIDTIDQIEYVGTKEDPYDMDEVKAAHINGYNDALDTVHKLTGKEIFDESSCVVAKGDHAGDCPMKDACVVCNDPDVKWVDGDDWYCQKHWSQKVKEGGNED